MVLQCGWSGNILVIIWNVAQNAAHVKLKFHWDQFPRNFPVANVTGKSPTSYEEVERVGRVASLLRGSYGETYPSGIWA